MVSTIDKFEVISYQTDDLRWISKQKDRAMYLEERERWAIRKKFRIDTKF